MAIGWYGAHVPHLRVAGPPSGGRVRDPPGRDAQSVGSLLRSERRIAACVGVRVDDRARCCDQTSSGMRRKRRAEVVGAAALRADAREQEDRAWHLLAQLS